VAGVATHQLISGAIETMHAGQWKRAAHLLEGAVSDEPLEQAALALARAQIAVDQDFWCGTRRGPGALHDAAAIVANAGDKEKAFDLEFLHLRHDYSVELFRPTGPDPASAEGLADRASRLLATAPDQRRAGWVTFHCAVIADNLRGDAETAAPLFAEALDAAERTSDDLLAGEALRHLGGAAYESGDLDRAEELWARATELWQKAGSVPGVLAQQATLADLALRRGNTSEAIALAREARRWARNLSVEWLETEAAELLERMGD
jgi:tetratricopeptide (TPR) repeat protein